MRYPIKWKPVSEELETKRMQLFDVQSPYRNGMTSDTLDITVPYRMPEVAKKNLQFQSQA